MAVVVSPDNRHVYVASWVDDSVAVFSRASASGALTFVALVQDGIDGVDGIYGASAIGISPDGGYLYVAGYLGTLCRVFA
jgi:6-phosphogluconolactonase (cycloisomerase 2 family)